MSKLPLVLSLSGIAALAGCASEHKVAPAPAPAVVQPAPTTPPAVGIRMDDGTLQYVDTAANDLAVGDRVSIASDGYMRHPAP